MGESLRDRLAVALMSLIQVSGVPLILYLMNIRVLGLIASQFVGKKFRENGHCRSSLQWKIAGAVRSLPFYGTLSYGPRFPPSLQSVSPASSRHQREMERAGYINAGPETSGRFFNEGPSQLDVAEDPTSARGFESEGRISSCQHSESAVNVSCELQAEGAGGTEGIGLSLEDIILLYENGEMDEEDLVAFVKATCLRNRDDLCKLIDRSWISPVQD